MEFYKLGGLRDMPKITVHMMDMPERGVIGIGEPPTISTAAAVGNAVFNAIGVRVPILPLITEARPRRPREGREGEMKNFTYHQPTTIQLALPLLDEQVGQDRTPGRRHRPARPAEGVRLPAGRVVSLTALGGAFREISSIAPPGSSRRSVTIGAGVKLVDIAESKLLDGLSRH